MEQARREAVSSEPGADARSDRGESHAAVASAAGAKTDRRDASDRQDPPPASRKPQSHAKRFAEPYLFDDDQHAAIDRALTEAGVDDPSGRAIFIGAIAYDVAALAAALRAPPTDTKDTAAPVREALQLRHEPPEVPTPAETSAAPGSRATGDVEDLAAVAQAAERLRQCLEALDDAARDRLLAAVSAADTFARGHGADYLAALALEAGRVGSSAGSAAERLAKPQQQARPSAAQPSPARVDVRPQASEPQPQMSDAAALHFIRQAARVYQESFDTAPTTRAAGPFARALAAIAKVTGLPIPTRVADLKRALSG